MRNGVYGVSAGLLSMLCCAFVSGTRTTSSVVTARAGPSVAFGSLEDDNKVQPATLTFGSLEADNKVKPSTPATSSRTKVVMLGTGTPVPDPDRAGPGVAIVVDSVAYLFDAGAGVVRRAAAAGRDGIAAFAPRTRGGQPSPRFDRVFISHLHSDHTLGLADVIFTPWIQGRVAPLDVYGPPGIKRLVDGILDGNAEDIAERVASSGGPSANGWKTVAHDVAEGEVFRDARVTVTAFAVPHSGWKYAFGYRIQTPDRLIVLSGDAREIGRASCRERV